MIIKMPMTDISRWTSHFLITGINPLEKFVCDFGSKVSQNIINPHPLWYFWSWCLVQRNQSWRCNNLSPDLSLPALLEEGGTALQCEASHYTPLHCILLHCIKGTCMTFPVGGAPLGLHHNSLLLSHHWHQHLQLTWLILDTFEKLITLWVCSAGKHYSSQEILKIISVCKFMQEFVFGEWKRPGFNLEADSHEISSPSQVKYTFKTPY